MSLILISDIHLQPGRPDLSAGLSRFLDNLDRDCQQLYLLGDLFEYWIGDDAPLPGAEQLAEQLHGLSDRGIQLFFQAGNRDFLVGQQWLKQAGTQLLPEAFKLRFPDGVMTLLMHGDQLCTDDTAYQAFRQQVRDPDWQQAFLHKSVDERIAIAEQLRTESKKQGAAKTDAIMDVSPATVQQVMEKAAVSRLIHGHTHRPAVHQLELTSGMAERMVLGDWGKKGWYIKADTTGTRLLSFAI
ncbi:UDP-2,3-diacylglucosamine diphosphatase [Nitrincola iocasae]|uniref:UDP-2,3-diacylglucosamine hydrolase n=1 Tax=Nitrincola iocasae TaxID=2614693 RepID=A0A5J6LED5_9GAMM|nr:UDP-2,3-diacylglucosamine diphosphatase [Nitrincola iocasae]QEW06521.1 UDP-2,3-diacylglucosamine diphosphatase [Nitrincola iocasae]